MNSAEGVCELLCGPCVRRLVLFVGPFSGARELTLYTHILRYPHAILFLSIYNKYLITNEADYA